MSSHDDPANEDPAPASGAWRPAEPPGADPPPERSSGLVLETCYGHPNQTTGVHCTRCGRPICPDCMTAAPVGYQCPECVAGAGRGAPRRGFRVRFALGRPGIVTTTLLVINIAVYLVEAAYGGSGAIFSGPSSPKLFNLGALFPPAIALTHQYWRLFSAMFLHAGLLHLALNMYALYLFGYLVEDAFGKPKFVVIYVLSGLLASVTSFAFGPIFEVGVGASGAIFGLLGAWVAYNYRRRQMRYNRANLQWAYTLIIINAILGFSIAGIDWRAHLGGLITGAVAGTLAEGVGPKGTRLVTQVVGFTALIALGVGLTAWRVATFPALSPSF